MTLAIEIDQSAGDRTRLLLPARRGDRIYLAAIARRFRAMPGVSATEVDPARGRILLRHAQALDLRGLRPAFWQVDEAPAAGPAPGAEAAPVATTGGGRFPHVAEIAIEAAMSAIARRPSPLLVEWAVTRIGPALIRRALGGRG